LLAVSVVGVHGLAALAQRDDVELWLLYSLSLVMIAGLGIQLSIQRQQTERRAREAELARKQLQTFMGMVAHELATPLTGVLGRAQLALRTARQSRERRALASIESEALNLARLVNDLRDAGRVGAGQFEIAREPLDLTDLVRRVVERRRHAAPERQIFMQTDDELHLTCDRGRIAQVVDNLLSNALKYSSPDEPVSVRLWRDGGDAVVSVTDRGAGIDEEERPRLFHPFSRLPRARSAPGTGLGLYISRAILEAHGGTIDVMSAVDRGSTFFVRLPGTDASGSEEDAFAQAPPARSVVHGG
jgi:signal transduction histidine kinase